MNPPIAILTQHSRYARQQLFAHPEWQAALESPRALSLEEITQLWQAYPIDDDASFKKAARQLRQQAMLRIYCRDLAGLADMFEVVASVSALADFIIQQANAFYHAQLSTVYGEPIGEDSQEVQQLMVVGMGKLGGKELNVSSDIDLVFLYPEEGQTTGGRKQISNHEFFVLLGKRIISAINDITEDGFVFRVDMMLRPHGSSGPLACSFAAFEHYLITQARMWERYAWIKGRAITGKPADIADMNTVVMPFIFRKYLDYSAYAAMRELHMQIKQDVQRRDMADNIKLGSGGIREVEFIAQVFQVIRGGRDASLQIQPTLQVLDLLSQLQHLPPQTVQDLRTAYIFLRNLEHRLQYLDDAQTQALPRSQEDQQQIALSMGFTQYGDFLKVLNSHRQKVHAYFEQVFSVPSAEGSSDHPLQTLWLYPSDAETATRTLAKIGYQDAPTTWVRITQFKNSGRYQQLPIKNKQRLDGLMPSLIEICTHQPQADDTLLRIFALLESICRRESYLALLAEHPQVLNRLASLYSASPWVSHFLTRHPILLDELIDPRSLYAATNWAEQATYLQKQLARHQGDTERQMDLLRDFQHAQIFRLVARDLAGDITLEQVSDELSALAELILQEVLHLAWQGIPTRHRDTPAFAIIGYGKLGGKELGYASDLDIIFLYDDNHPDASELYAKLAKRMINWLNTMTQAGILYEIDLQLRPNGNSGLLVSQIDAFADYQTQKAWTWEHQALTRARFCVGDAQIGQAFESIRNNILQTPRDNTHLRQEVATMRQKMRDNTPKTPDGLFDIKKDAGGLIDLEFAVQTLILSHAAQHPTLCHNAGNIALLGYAAQAGLIPNDLAIRTQNAYRHLRHTLHLQQLAGNTAGLIPIAQALPYQEAIQALWKILFV